MNANDHDQLALFTAGDCVEVGKGRIIARQRDADRCQAAYDAGFDLGVRNVERCGKRWNETLAKHNGDNAHHYADPDTQHIRDEFCRGYYEGCCQRMGIDPNNPHPLPRAQAQRLSRPAIRYRNTETGETWTGRGQQPAWLRSALQSGRSIEEFLVREAA